MSFIFQRYEPKRLQAPRGTHESWIKNFRHSLNRTFASLECDFDEIPRLKRLGQDQQSASGRKFVQLGANRGSPLHSDRNEN